MHERVFSRGCWSRSRSGADRAILALIGLSLRSLSPAVPPLEHPILRQGTPEHEKHERALRRPGLRIRECFVESQGD